MSDDEIRIDCIVKRAKADASSPQRHHSYEEFKAWLMQFNLSPADWEKSIKLYTVNSGY